MAIVAPYPPLTRQTTICKISHCNALLHQLFSFHLWGVLTWVYFAMNVADFKLYTPTNIKQIWNHMQICYFNEMHLNMSSETASHACYGLHMINIFDTYWFPI